MTTPPLPRRFSSIDGIFAGTVIALVILTLHGLGENVTNAFGDTPTRPGEPARRFHLTVDDRDENEHINVRVPAGLVESFAGLIGGDAVVRFDDEVREAQLDFPRLSRELVARPAGESWTESGPKRTVTAKRTGDLVEIRVEERTDEEPAASATPPPPVKGAAPKSSAPPATATAIGDEDSESDSSSRDEDADASKDEQSSRDDRHHRTDWSIGWKVDTDRHPRHRHGGVEIVTIRLPWSIVERFAGASGDRVRIDLGELVRDLRRKGPIEILTVESDSESVRIALD